MHASYPFTEDTSRSVDISLAQPGCLWVKSRLDDTDRGWWHPRCRSFVRSIVSETQFGRASGLLWCVALVCLLFLRVELIGHYARCQQWLQGGTFLGTLQGLPLTCRLLQADKDGGYVVLGGLGCSCRSLVVAILRIGMVLRPFNGVYSRKSLSIFANSI